MEKLNLGGMSAWKLRALAASATLLVVVAFLASSSGCYAPLHSHGIPAATLPDEFRVPWRTGGPNLNLASLTAAPPVDYLLGPDDVLEIIVHGLVAGEPSEPILARVMGDGQIHLPIVGAVKVGGLNLLQAQEAVTRAYADGVLKEPRVSVALAEKSTIDVLVLGEVKLPGVYRLPKYENDIAHALAMAGGLTVTAELEIEVHRRIHTEVDGTIELLPPPDDIVGPCPHPFDPSLEVLRIPLRGFAEQPFRPQDVVLTHGSVVLVPSRRDEVFFVVGKLSQNNAVRFSLGREERELGSGFVLPRDREIDVVTAVAMAGYIDPIDSPTTVTVHRVRPDGEPLLIKVDLIKARYDRLETVLVEAGDIIYLNPDACWWTRRTFDRVVPDLITLPYGEAMRRWINPRSNRQ
jgi:polysaccharide export outer membrane protein